MKVGRVFFVVLLMMGVMFSMSHAARTNNNDSMLRGLKKVGVFVELVKPPVDVPGLSRNQLQGDLESKLRQAGLNVVTSANLGDLAQLPFIYLNLTIRKVESVYAYNADFFCLNPSQKASSQASTAVWNQANSGIVKEMLQVREKVTDLVNLFIKDYRAANSRARFGGTADEMAATFQSEARVPRGRQN